MLQDWLNTKQVFWLLENRVVPNIYNCTTTSKPQSMHWIFFNEIVENNSLAVLSVECVVVSLYSQKISIHFRIRKRNSNCRQSLQKWLWNISQYHHWPLFLLRGCLAQLEKLQIIAETNLTHKSWNYYSF